MKHLQNGLNLQSWGLQVVVWLFKTFNVVFQNCDPQTYELLKDFGLKVHSEFPFWPDVFLSRRALKRPLLQADLAAFPKEQGRSSLLASTVKAQKCVAVLSKGREFRKGFTQTLLWQQEFFFLSCLCCEILLFPGMLWNAILMFGMLADLAASFLH